METDEQLMVRYVAGDRRAFAALHALRTMLRRLASRHAGRRADVADLVQQTFTPAARRARPLSARRAAEVG